MVELRQTFNNSMDSQTEPILTTLIAQFDTLSHISEDFFGQKFFNKKMLDLFYKQVDDDNIEKIVTIEHYQRQQPEESCDDAEVKRPDYCLVKARTA